MRKETSIDGSGYRYLSQIPELKDGLPKGIFNKQITDVGGTFVALSCKSDYIIVTPTIDLVQSIMADENVPYPVMGVYNGVLKSEFVSYINENSVHKIAVTYDSLPKVRSWLEKEGFDCTYYKLLVDECHLLLEDMGFREKAINGLISELSHFKHYTLMTATPVDVEFLPSRFKELPYTWVNWGRNEIVRPYPRQTRNVYKSTVQLIKEFRKGLLLPSINGKLEKVKQLFIFLNSVQGIKQIIDTCGLSDFDDVKVVCADNLYNAQILGDITISKVTDPNAEINFFTKKAFQGCNLFSNNALVVVVSDGQMKHTLIDISTTMHQIAGRLRVNGKFNNIFKHIVYHIYSVRRAIRTDEEFSEMMKKNRKEVKTIISTYSQLSPEVKQTFVNRMNIEDLVCNYDPDSDSYVYNEDKEKYLEYNHRLMNKVYQSGLAIRGEYEKSGFHARETIYRHDEDIILQNIETASYEKLLRQYIALLQKDSDEALIKKYELEYPEFKQAVEQLGIKGIETCKYREKEIRFKLKATSPEIKEKVFVAFYKEIGEDKFITKFEAKRKLRIIYDRILGKGYKPTLSVLRDCEWFTVSESKTRDHGKQIEGIVIRQITRPITIRRNIKQVA